MLAIENVQFTFYIVILAIRDAFLWQSRTLFVYQIGCSRLPLIQCVDCEDNLKMYTGMDRYNFYATKGRFSPGGIAEVILIDQVIYR